MIPEQVMQQLRVNFSEEARELCAKATQDLLTLEGNAKPEDLKSRYQSLARHFHTLKGSAATVGIDELAALGHRLEDALAPFHKAQVPLPASAIDALLGALDLFLLWLNAKLAGEPLPELSVAFARVAAIGPAQAAPAPAPSQPGPAPSEPAPAPAPSAPEAAPSARPDDGWRIDTRRVTSLAGEAERLRELHLRLEGRQRELARVIEALKHPVDGVAEAETLLVALKAGLVSDTEEAGNIVQSLEADIKAVWTLPVRTLTDPLVRAVRDLCRTSGKEARLSVVGAEISLDRRVLDALKGPLVQLVRNAVDHGFEPPAERMARGKHREGSLVIRVEQQGNVVFLSVEDDGGGLDTQRIRQSVVKMGLKGADEVARLQDSQVHQLVFLSGLSTRDAVSLTSGRGVGLDVVARQVQALKGTVEVLSTERQGARFTLTLPVELGSSPVLVVRVGEHPGGIPLAVVEAVALAQPRQVRASSAGMELEFRDQVIPLNDLSALLGLRQPEVPRAGTPLIVLQSLGKWQALAVDEILGDQDLVIRSMPVEVQALRAYQGVSTLPRGELLPILRPEWLVGLGREVSRFNGSRRVLVVDDSLTARALHRAILEAAGFSVHAVPSGAQALQFVQRTSYDAIVCDVVMEGMSGLEFTRALRASGARVPVVLVSTLDTQEARSRGLEAGANAFLTKHACEAGRLVAELTALMGQQAARA